MKPINRKEKFLDAILTGNTEDLPVPITREETYLDEIAKKPGGGGSSNYNDLNNRPQMNSVTLAGNKSTEDLIPIGSGLRFNSNGELEATGGGGGTSDYDDLDNKPQINSVTLSGNKSLADIGVGDPSDLDTTVKTDLVSAINELVAGNSNNYSTSEKVVGTWIDGKPLYQKTIACGAMPNATTKTVASGLTNENVNRIYGFTINSTGIVIPLPYVDVSSNSAVQIHISYLTESHEIRIMTGSDRRGFSTSYVTLQYTKTTD